MLSKLFLRVARQEPGTAQRVAFGRVLAAGAILAGFAAVADAADPVPSFADEFTGSALGPAWRARQGLWRVADGNVAGRKDPTSKHPAKLDLLLPQGDGVLEFSFKTDHPGGVDLFFNRGDLRIAVVQLRAEGLAFATYPKTKDVPSEPTYLARCERRLEPHVWRKVRIERRKGSVWVECDTGQSLEVMDSGLEDEATTWLFNLRGPPDMTFWLDHVRASPAR